MAEIVPRWEWRGFASRFPRADAAFEAMTPHAVEESDELYLLAPGGDNVKIRADLVDVKVLRETDDDGLQRFEPILKAAFPLDDKAASTVFTSLRQQPVTDPVHPTDGLTLDALLAEAEGGSSGGTRVVR